MKKQTKQKSPASKQVTITDVARKAKVSRTAVSQVLNNVPIRISDDKRQLILDTARQMKYRPHIGARRLSLQKWETIALIFPDQPRALFQLYLFELTRELTATAREFSYDILLDFVHSAQPSSFDPNAGKVDGTIIVSDLVPPKELIADMKKCGHPYVVLGGDFPQNHAVNCIRCDVEQGTRELTQHLLDRGHRQIAFFQGVPSPDKLSGYKTALSEAGVSFSNRLVFQSGVEHDSITEALRKMLQLKKQPTAIVASNDILAIRICNLLKNFGYNVPDDFSVTGFDDIELAELFTPPITTSRIPIQAFAQTTIKQLVSLMENKTSATIHEVLKPELVVRESTNDLKKS